MDGRQFMNSPSIKLDRELKLHLEALETDAPVYVEIVPVPNGWRGLLRQLRDAASGGVAYNVVDLTSISATLPRWLIERIALRRDVAAVRLGEVDE